MNTRSSISKEKLYALYSSGRSMTDIAKDLNCSLHKVAYWMNKHGVDRRTRSEASYLKANPNGDPFSIKGKLTPKEMFLYGLGIGIYWGEGEKTSRNAVRVANTDPFVIKKFVQFLLEICQLEKRKLIYNLICFNDSNPEEVRKYWAKELCVSTEKFGKIVQIPAQGKGTYKKKSKFGVCIVIVCNMKLKLWTMEEINKIKLARIV